MSSINPIANSSASLRITPSSARAATAASAVATAPRLSDRVELSGVDRFLTALRANDIRAEKVAEIRSQIAASSYDEDAKIDAVLDKVLDDLDR